jgi:hypothetical protein
MPQLHRKCVLCAALAELLQAGQVSQSDSQPGSEELVGELVKKLEEC